MTLNHTLVYTINGINNLLIQNYTMRYTKKNMTSNTECGNHGRYAVLKSIDQNYIQNNFIWFARQINKIMKFQIYPQISSELLPTYSFTFVAEPNITNTDISTTFEQVIIINMGNNIPRKILLFKETHERRFGFQHKASFQQGISIIQEPDAYQYPATIQVNQHILGYIIIKATLKTTNNQITNSMQWTK